MRKLILPASVLFWTTLFTAGGLDPLNIKTGLWEVTMTSKVNLLPAPTTSTYKSCVRKEDLNQYPFTDPDANCNWKVIHSTGSEMEASGTCKPEGMGNVTFNMKLEAVNTENVKGTGQLTANGPAGTLNGIYSGMAKWIGAICPKGLK
jgi:hypothetical protein